MYKVAKIKRKNGTLANMMEDPLKKLESIFSPKPLSRLLCLKYDFNIPKNRQARLSAREGIHLSNTILDSYMHNRITKLKEFIENIFKEFVQQTKHLIVDGTTKFVGVKIKEDKAYWRKYLWTLFAKHIKRFEQHEAQSACRPAQWSFIITITAAGHQMLQNHYWNILWEPYPLINMWFTGCTMLKTQKYFI